MAFLKKHYEKILLGTLMTIFIVLLGFQFLLWQQGQKISVDKFKEFVEPPPNYKNIDFEAQESPFNVLVNLSEMLKWEKSPKRETGSKNYSDFMLPYAMALCPYCKKMIPASNFPPVNSEQLGECVLCLKPLRAPIRQVANLNLDSDGDGIPDKEEVALGLNPNDASDGTLDFDDDGFTNFEEYVSGTKIRDPKSRPHYHEKITVVSIEKTILPITVKQIDFRDREDKKTATVQIEVQGRRRPESRYLKLGDSFSCGAGTFTIEDIVPTFEQETVKGTNSKLERNRSYLILAKRDSNDKIEAHLRKQVTEPREKIVLHIDSLKKDKEREYYLGDRFELGTLNTGIDKYIIQSADSKTKKVVLKFENNQKDYTITVKSAMQTKLEQRKNAAKPAAAKKPKK